MQDEDDVMQKGKPETLHERTIGCLVSFIPLYCLLFGLFLPEIRRFVQWLLGN